MMNKVLISVNALLLLTTYTSAFFWGTSDDSTPAPRYYYQKRVVAGPQYGFIEQDNRPVPSVPIQVPLQAQFAPYSNLQNVQLVPCLCPVSQENFQEQQVPYETVYFNPNYQVPPPPQHHPQQNMQTPPHQSQKP